MTKYTEREIYLLRKHSSRVTIEVWDVLDKYDISAEVQDEVLRAIQRAGRRHIAQPPLRLLRGGA